MALHCDSSSEYVTYQVLFAIFLEWKEYFSAKVAHSTVLHSLLIGTVMTPNYIDSNSLSVAPWCDCSNSGNDIDECLKFLNFFQDNTCLSEYKIRCLKCVLGYFLEFLYCLSTLRYIKAIFLHFISMVLL